MRPSRATAVIVALVFSVAACSVPTDESAVAIDADQLPLSLRPGTTTTTTTTTVAEQLTETATMYLLESVANSERTVVREIMRDVALNATLADVISMIFGPDVRSQEEVELGYSNALFELSLLDATVQSVSNWDGGVAVIDIQPLTPEGEPSEEAFTGDLIGAAAQLVFTATAYQAVTGVQILINGIEVPIPTNDRDFDPGEILVRENYERFNPDIPDVVPTTTTVTEASG